MGATKKLYTKWLEEQPLGEEARAELHWMEQEFYSRYPKRDEYDNR
jgi:hypothetical protein